MPKEKTTFWVSNYSTRYALESDIKSSVGTDTQKNKEANIEVCGTKKQLKQLRLNDTCTIWGIKVVSSDGSTQKDLKLKLEANGKTWK